MSAGLTIRADGMDWPLATFLDAYGFHQLDWRSSTAPLDTDLTLEVVVREGDGVAVKRMIGRHVDRHNCLAIKRADCLHPLALEPEPLIPLRAMVAMIALKIGSLRIVHDPAP